MRLAVTLTMLGLLTVGAASAPAQERSANVPVAPGVRTATDVGAITVAWRPRYEGAPQWYRYERPYYPRHYTYYPRDDWRVAPRYYGYYGEPYPAYNYGFSYPGGLGFQFYGPRGRFGVDF
jgi:hypothetical protein